MKIRPRGPNRWQLAWELGRDPVTKKRQQRWETFYGSYEAAVRQWWRVQEEIERGVRANPRHWTIGEVADRWLKEVVSRRKVSTQQDYTNYVTMYIQPRWGSTKLTDCTAMALDAWYQHLLTEGGSRQQGLSPRTVEKIHQTLHRIYQQAIRWGLIGTDPTINASPPRGQPDPPVLWTATQLRQFWTVAQADRLAVFFWLLLTTGMRRGEILGLTWDSIDWERRWIQIRHTLFWPDRAATPVLLASPKTPAGYRTIVIGERTIALLRQHQRQQAAEAAGFREDWPLVLRTQTGRPVHPRNVLRTFERLCRMAGVPRCTLHDLRHAVTSQWAQLNPIPRAVSDRLGHARVDFTLDYYTHLSPEAQRQWAETWEQELGGCPPGGQDGGQEDHPAGSPSQGATPEGARSLRRAQPAKP